VNLHVTMIYSVNLTVTHPHTNASAQECQLQENIFIIYFWLVKLFNVLCLCDILYCKSDNENLKRNSVNKEFVVNSCNHCVFYYLISGNFEHKIFRKLGEIHFLAYKRKRGRGNGFYIDLENKSCYKEDISIHCFLTLHKTHTTKE